jgi:hypothetical protein
MARWTDVLHYDAQFFFNHLHGSNSSQATFGGVIYDAGSWTGASADQTQETPEHLIDVWETN